MSGVVVAFLCVAWVLFKIGQAVERLDERIEAIEDRIGLNDDELDDELDTVRPGGFSFCCCLGTWTRSQSAFSPSWAARFCGR